MILSVLRATVLIQTGACGLIFWLSASGQGMLPIWTLVVLFRDVTP